MSYIRTKDGVYEMDETNEKNLNSNVIDIYNCLGLENQIRKCDIINQSENLEELCDEFVIHRKEMNYNFVWNKERNVGFYYFCSFPEKYDVYGCIWTDKGLQFVARINSKGELELI